MNREDYLAVGTIVKTHGIHGEVIIAARIPDLLINIKEAIVLEIDGLLVPFFINKIQPTSKERFRVKFDWVDTEPQAKKIVNSEAFLKTKDIDQSNTDFIDNYDMLVGFLVTDSKYGELGVVDYTLESNDNPLMAVTYKNNEILFPIHPDIITDVDIDNKTISIDSPEGLIELYLG